MLTVQLWARPSGLAVGCTARIVAKVILAGLPLTASYIVLFHATSLHRPVVWIGIVWRKCRAWLRPLHLKYRDPDADARYWRRASRDQKTLQASNASNIPPEVPLVKFYVPKLLPAYRSPEVDEPEETEYHLPARTYLKWHHMIFPGPRHPTLRQAEVLVRWHSSRDRREMYRISRLLTDEEVFGTRMRWDPRYRTMWRAWLAAKGPDVAIVFV